MWLVALLGCLAPEVSAFLDDRAAAICARHARCDTLADAGYADEADCVATIATSDGAAHDEGALACDPFHEDAVPACLAAWDTPCDVPPDLTPCDEVCG